MPRPTSATGTNSGKRKNLPKSVLQAEKIEHLTQDCIKTWDDSEAVLGKACMVVAERNEARGKVTELSSVLDQMQALFDCARSIINSDKTHTQKIDEMSEVFAGEHEIEKEQVNKEVLR